MLLAIEGVADTAVGSSALLEANRQSGAATL